MREKHLEIISNFFNEYNDLTELTPLQESEAVMDFLEAERYVTTDLDISTFGSRRFDFLEKRRCEKHQKNCEEALQGHVLSAYDDRYFILTTPAGDEFMYSISELELYMRNKNNPFI